MTGGTDKVVKVWNINEEGGQREVSLVISRDLGIVCFIALYHVLPLIVL